MSYILEALKKAEAERNGAVHKPTPFLPPLVTSSRNPPAWRRPLPSAGLAALAITLASAAWFTLSRKEETPKAPLPAAAQEKAPPAPVAAPPAVPEPIVAEPVKAKEKPVQKKPVEKKHKPRPDETSVAKAPAPEPAVGTLQDLPAQIQHEIPAFTVGGYIYSGSKADRSVLINGRLLHEGDEAAPGLVLEKMTPSGMILGYKGYRYRRGY
jgi:general secretion pathway protein B